VIRRGRGLVVAAAGLLVGLTACVAPADEAADGGAGATSGEASGAQASPDATPAAAAADPVDACQEPVAGFAVTVDADGEPLPDRAPPSDAEAGEDPRELLGPSTATVDQTVFPVAGDVEPALPVTVNSCDGETVVIDDASRILAVDLYGTLAEIVFSLDLGDNVVGRDASTGFPQAADLPLVTPGGHDMNAEAILELDPTVVLTDASVGPPEVQQQLRDAGIPVVFFDDARDLDRIPSQIRAVAGALGVPEAGEALVERTSGEIADALALAPAGADPLRIAFLYTRGGMVQLLAGPGSGADAMIRSIGAVDVGTDIGLERPFTQITSEALIEAAPDVIIMMTKGLESIGGVDGMLELPGVAQTPAGEKLRVVDMADSVLLSFGPRTGRTIEALAHAVYQP
jgi:iron complex transport system substrate-binding protein